MANITITECDLGSVELEGGKFRDETLYFSGADTYVAGTILARRSVATAVTASAITGTGNGTVTSATVVEGPVVPLVGAYTLRCIEAVTHGGVFRLEDPNGAIVADYLALSAGAGNATTFEAAGLRFTVTDGSTDFAAGDTATLTVAADGKLVPFAIAGVGGAQRPIAVLTYEVTKDGAGNEPVRVLVAGEVSKARLVIDADGDNSNVSAAVMDQMRAAGIVVTDVTDIAVLDNQ